MKIEPEAREGGSGGAEAAAAGERRAQRAGAWALWLTAGALVVLGVVIVGRSVGQYVPAFGGWVAEQGAWAPAVFVVGYAMATVALVPGSLLSLAAGAVFGIVAGTVYVFAGAVIGSTLAFLIARHIAREPVERRVARDPRFLSIDSAIGRQGLKIVFLLRLSPVFPFNLMNYALGLTRVKLVDYVVASVGMLPGTVLYVYAGSLAGSLVAVAAGAEVPRGPGYYLVLGLGLLATAAVTIVITRIARRALTRETEDVTLTRG